MTPDRKEQRELVDDIAFFRDLISDLSPLDVPAPRRQGRLFDPEHQPLRPVGDLADEAMDLMFLAHDIRTGAATIQVAVVGDFSAGKSTLINALLGSEICPTRCDPTTSSITYFEYGEELSIQQEPGGVSADTHPPLSELISLERYHEIASHPSSGKGKRNRAMQFRVRLPAPVLRSITLIDTPGFNNPDNPHDTKVTEAATRAADVLVLVMNIHKGEPSADLLATLRRLAHDDRPAHERTPALLLINQADRMRVRRKRTEVVERNRKEYAGLFATILLISAVKLEGGPEVEFATALHQLGSAVETAVRDRLPFAVAVGGADRGSGYTVSMDGRDYMLGNQAWADLATRRDLLDQFDKIRAQRSELILRGFNERRARYAARRLSGLEALERAIRGGLPAGGPVNQPDLAGIAALEEQLSKIVERAAVALSRPGLRVFAQLFSSEVIPKKEKSYVFTPYYRVVYTRQGVKKAVRGIREWSEIGRDLKTLAKVAQADWGHPLDAPGLLERVREEAANEMFEVIPMAKNWFSDEYDDQGEAELAIKWHFELDPAMHESPNMHGNLLASPLIDGLTRWLDGLRIAHGRKLGADDAQLAILERVLGEISTFKRTQPAMKSLRKATG